MFFIPISDNIHLIVSLDLNIQSPKEAVNKEELDKKLNLVVKDFFENLKKTTRDELIEEKNNLIDE